jgi:hypothetical protein
VSQTRVALDFSLSPRLVGVLAAMYGHQGHDFRHLKDLGISGNTPDPKWADKYKQFGGRIVLSGDTRIAYTPHLALAFIDNGLICFFPAEPYNNLKVHAQVAAFVYWWPKIAEKITTTIGSLDGGCWRIPCLARKDDLRLSDKELEPLVIPASVLAAYR